MLLPKLMDVEKAFLSKKGTRLITIPAILAIT
jgi:hypothetical protein